MADRLTPAKRARLYLEASKAGSYTGLPKEHREAYESQMRAHERAYPGVREHALAGADKHFDKPLQSGTREHQTYLQEKAGLEHGDILKIRKHLDGDTKSGSTRTRRPPNPRYAGPRVARRAAALGTGAIASSIPGAGGNTLMYGLGLLLALSLLYLLVAGKGMGALTGIVNVIVGGVRAFIAPEDPLKAFESAIGATPISSSSSTQANTAGEPSSGGSPAPGSVTPTGSSAPPQTGQTAPAPQTAAKHAIGARHPSASLLEADIKLRASNRTLIAQHKLTPKQAAAREERLIPRRLYPAWYSH